MHELNSKLMKSAGFSVMNTDISGLTASNSCDSTAGLQWKCIDLSKSELVKPNGLSKSKIRLNTIKTLKLDCIIVMLIFLVLIFHLKKSDNFCLLAFSFPLENPLLFGNMQSMSPLHISAQYQIHINMSLMRT